MLLFETDSALSTAANKALHSSSALRLFQTQATSDFSTALNLIGNDSVDVLLIDADLEDHPDFSLLKRLHHQNPKIPCVALLRETDQSESMHILENGAGDYFLEGQISDDIFPVLLLRSFERMRSQKIIHENEERFRLMIENASDVIFILDGSGVVSYASPSTQHILRHAPGDLTGRNALDFIHRDDRMKFLGDFEKAFEQGDRLASVQFRFRRADENWVHLEGRGRIVPDRSGKRVCILNSHDVSHRIKLEEELRSLSLRDELTGLHNRRSFVSFLDQQIKLRGRSKGKNLYLLFIDLDEFKWINDNLGHKVGDQALMGASQVLKNTFRDADIIARLGGDEFVVLLAENVRDVNVNGLKDRLWSGLANWNQKEMRPYQLKMSVGVVEHDPVAHKTTQEFLAHADHLMYEQKRQKKEARLSGNSGVSAGR